MRILHVGDCAFVGENLVKGLRKKGHEVDHLIKPWRLPSFREYDVVHMHYPYHFWKFFVVLLTKYKKLVLHWHGSDLRNYGHRGFLKDWFKRLADEHIVPTKDLKELMPEAHLIVNPVDTQQFFPIVPFDSRKKFLVIDNTRQDRHEFAHWEMPFFLSEYKRITVIPGSPKFGVLNPGLLSVTALEALACGCRVSHHPKKNRKWVLRNASIPVATKKVLKVYGIKK